jgi:MFS family permease
VPHSQRVHPWATFAALSLLFFLVNAGTFSSLGVVLPSMVHELHWTWAQAGMGYTVLGLSCGLSSLLPTLLIRRLGVRSPLLGGTVLLVVGFTVLARAHTVAAYLAGALMTGMANTLTATIPGTHVLTGLFKRRSAVLGAYFTAGALGAVAGPLFFVLVHAVTQGWRMYWVAFAVASALLGVFAVLVTPNRLAKAAVEPPELLAPSEIIENLNDWTVRRALAAPQYYVIVGSYMLYLLINTTAHGFAVEHLSERGIDPRAAAAMMSLEAFIGAAVSLGGGLLGERIGAKWLLVTALVTLGIGTAALAEAHGYGLMLVYAIGMGISFGLIFVAPPLLLLNYFGRKPNLELYSLMGLFSVVAAAGPTIAGWARDTLGSFAGMFLLFSVSTLIMLALALVMTAPVFSDERRPQSLPREAA